MKGGPPRATFRDVLAVREFRVLWTSVILSTAGDRLVLVALTLLVYGRTHSPLLAALVYAAGYLPWVIGGLFLADVADRLPEALGDGVLRRGPRGPGRGDADPARAGRGPGGAAVRGHHVRAVRSNRRGPPSPRTSCRENATCWAPRSCIRRCCPLRCSARSAGAWAVAFIGVQRSLAVDAATFVLSGLLIALGTRARPAAARPETVQPSPAGPDARRIPADLRRPRAAHAAAVRLAGGLLHDSRGNRGSVRGQARGRADRRQPGHRVDDVQHDDRYPAVHAVRPATPAGQPDGPAGRADLRLARPDGPGARVLPPHW